MIKYALICHDCDYGFDSWFASCDAFDQLVENASLSCPACDSRNVAKAIMAPAVRSSRKKDAVDFEQLASRARAHIASHFDHVGDRFADEARAMYFGDKAYRPIWGQTTREESAALEEEGVPAAPLPPAFAPRVPKAPDELN